MNRRTDAIRTALNIAAARLDSLHTFRADQGAWSNLLYSAEVESILATAGSLPRWAREWLDGYRRCGRNRMDSDALQFGFQDPEGRAWIDWRGDTCPPEFAGSMNARTLYGSEAVEWKHWRTATYWRAARFGRTEVIAFAVYMDSPVGGLDYKPGGRHARG